MSRRLPFFLLSAIVFLAMTPGVSFAQVQYQLMDLGSRSRLMSRRLFSLFGNDETLSGMPF